MAYKIEISKPAQNDALAYAKYVAQDQLAPDAARKWLIELEAEINLLTELPHRFPLIAEAELLGGQYRDFIFFSHRVVYSVIDAEEKVVVHRIYHGSKKPMNRQDMRGR